MYRKLVHLTNRNKTYTYIKRMIRCKECHTVFEYITTRPGIKKLYCDFCLTLLINRRGRMRRVKVRKAKEVKRLKDFFAELDRKEKWFEKMRRRR